MSGASFRDDVGSIRNSVTNNLEDIKSLALTFINHILLLTMSLYGRW